MRAHFRFRDPPMERMGHDIPSHPSVGPDCGYLTHDEAAILYEAARRWPKNWIDIGCRFGWSTAHIAAARANVIGCDPLLADDLLMDEAICPSPVYRDGDKWEGVWGLTSATSSEVLTAETLVSAAHIDGCHDWPEPLLDAARAIKAGAKVLVWHDFLGEPVQRAVYEITRAHGWVWCTYWTPNGMAVAWEPSIDFEPPAHQRDERVDWKPHERAVAEFRQRWIQEQDDK